MTTRKPSKTNKSKRQKRNTPPGKIKLANAMRQLLENKDFYSITTDEIAKTAGTNEALIYRYFGDKRALLHYVLAEYLREAYDRIIDEIREAKGALERLKIIVGESFDIYCKNRVFAKIILIEVRNFPGYFESDTYKLAQRYTKLWVEVIKEGMSEGVIRDDLPPEAIRDIIIGGIEHVMLPTLFFDREAKPDLFSDMLYSMIIEGIVKEKKPAGLRSKGRKAIS